MPVVTYSAVAMRLRKAADPLELERVGHLIQFVPSIADREKLNGIYKERSTGFKAPKD